ncbi:unnamed protein product [Victoria cruziana]
MRLIHHYRTSRTAYTLLTSSEYSPSRSALARGHTHKGMDPAGKANSGELSGKKEYPIDPSLPDIKKTYTLLTSSEYSPSRSALARGHTHKGMDPAGKANSGELSGKKEYPIDPSLPDIKNSIYTTDEFRIFSFKVRPCSRAYSHDWTDWTEVPL